MVGVCPSLRTWGALPTSARHLASQPLELDNIQHKQISFEDAYPRGYSRWCALRAVHFSKPARLFHRVCFSQLPVQ